MGLDTILKISLRVLFFSIFLGVVWYLIDYIFGFLPTVASSLGGDCVGYFADRMGLASSLGIFLKILIVGFVGKQIIAYVRNSI